MFRRKLVPLFILAAALSACQGKTPTATEVAATATKVAVAQSSPTVPIAIIGATPGSVPEDNDTSIPVGCTVVSPRPTPGPTQQSLFPSVGEGDWVRGPGTARVTIIEYSDFQ